MDDDIYLSMRGVCTYTVGVIVVSSAAYYYYNFFRGFIPTLRPLYGRREKFIFTVAGLGSTSAEPLCVQDGQRGSVKTARHPTHTHARARLQPFCRARFRYGPVTVYDAGAKTGNIRRPDTMRAGGVGGRIFGREHPVFSDERDDQKRA